MAKQTKSAVAPAATAPAAPGAPATTTAPKIERGLNDRFTAVVSGEKDGAPVYVDPPKKLAPQAMVIINTIRAAGAEGLTRAQLNANLKGVLQTRQPESRIVTYYQKDLLASGAVQLVKAPDAPAAAPATPAVPAA